jgi:hypothetical protein
MSDAERRHLRWGWWALLGYLLLGIALEWFHATKASFYLDVDQETRRLLLRLSHAHGTLLAIVNILYGLTVPRLTAPSKLISPSLLSALLLVPLGFFTAALTAQGADAGLPVVLVPAGAVALILGVALTARGVS